MIKTHSPIDTLIHLPSQLQSALSKVPRAFLKLTKAQWVILIQFLEGCDLIQLLQLNKKTWQLRLHKPIERMLVSEQQRLLRGVLSSQQPFKMIDKDCIEIQFVPKQWEVKKPAKVSLKEFVMGKMLRAKRRASPRKNPSPEKKGKGFASKLCPALFLKNNFPELFQKYFIK